MAFPPTNLTPVELARHLAAPRPSDIVEFPRRDVHGASIGRIRIVVLEMGDHDWAREEAARRFKARGLDPKEMPDSPSLRELHGDIAARCLLSRSVCTVDPIHGSENAVGCGTQYAKLFPTPEHLDVLSADELNILFTQHLMVHEKYGYGANAVQSDAELTAWIKVLAEGMSALPLSRLPWRALAALSFGLAKRAYGVSALLDSLSESSPTISKSVPASWSFGTGFYGAQRANAIAPGLIPGVAPAESPNNLPPPSADAPVPELLSLDEATEQAKSLGYAGGPEGEIDGDPE